MTVIVNGEERELTDGATVAQLVGELAPAGDGRGIAVACNGNVVVRSAWAETPLRAGDRVEILHAVQGG